MKERFIKLTESEKEELKARAKTFTQQDVEYMVDEMLDETYPLIEFGVLSYTPSQVLRAVDPIAYNEEIKDHLDIEGYTECLWNHEQYVSTDDIEEILDEILQKREEQDDED